MTNVIPKLTKGCDKECRILQTSQVSTLAAWTPIYNKKGELVNEDPNSIYSFYSCNVCGAKWNVIVKGKKETIIRL